jgi:predicted phage terminase large subunit-like protein
VSVRRVVLPKPMAHQVPVLLSAARFKVVCAGRRWGKTLAGLCAVVEGHGPNGEWKGALNGGQIWWVAPTYPLASQIWHDLTFALGGALDERSSMERRVWLPGGGNVSVKSATDPDSLRGVGLDGVVMDEAAFVDERAWTQAIRPALADRGGWAMFISTPRGKNWFWRLFEEAARTPGWERWQSPTAANPRIPAQELEAARSALSEWEYAQEFLAQFVAESGTLFRREYFRYWRSEGDVYALGDERRVPAAACRVMMTCDIAASTKERSDYTVFAVWAVTPDHELVLLDVVRGRIEVPDQPAVLAGLARRYAPGQIFVETRGYQLGLAQTAIREGLPMVPCNAPGDKWARAQPAAARLKAGAIWWPEEAPWVRAWEDELISFPGGEHDDQVDVLAYAALQVMDAYSGLADYYRRLRGGVVA